MSWYKIEKYIKIGALSYELKAIEEEHDNQVRTDAISEFVNAYMKDEEQYDGCRECERIDDYCCIQCFRDRFLK